MIDNKLYQIRKYMINNKDGENYYEDTCNEYQIDLIKKYQLEVIKDKKNFHERICCLIVLDNIINFEISEISTNEDIINNYIEHLNYRKVEILEIVEKIIPKDTNKVELKLIAIG